MLRPPGCLVRGLAAATQGPCADLDQVGMADVEACGGEGLVDLCEAAAADVADFGQLVGSDHVE
ncbi:hypothetical protein GCM10023178_07190 [Actinomadura luteofluorescens]